MSLPMDPVMVAETWELGSQQVSGVHLTDQCEPPCPLHAPSDHPMRDYRLIWRNDRALFERRCPHGVGHPDPDHLDFIERNRGAEAASSEGVHGCDGCCR